MKCIAGVLKTCFWCRFLFNFSLYYFSGLYQYLIVCILYEKIKNKASIVGKVSDIVQMFSLASWFNCLLELVCFEPDSSLTVYFVRKSIITNAHSQMFQFLCEYVVVYFIILFCFFRKSGSEWWTMVTNDNKSYSWFYIW